MSFKLGNALCAAAIALALLALPPAAPAHHSHAEFSTETQIIEGELLSVAWRNPHPALTLGVVNDSGQDEVWHIQVLGNINGLRRDGVTGGIFTVGERMRIAGQVSSRRPGLLLASSVRFADGTETILGPDESSGSAIYRAGVAARRALEPDPAIDPATNQPKGIYRVWMVAERFRNPSLPLTDAARAAKDAWDSVTDDPQLGCQPLGMPGAMMSPHPIEFLAQGENIILRLEEWDALRTIHTSPDSGAASQPATRMGYSVGRWEADTLVVTTTNIRYPYMDEHGTPQTEAVEVVERFTLSADERSLDWTAMVTDPGTLTEPVVAFTTRWEWVPGEALQVYDCAVLDAPAGSGAAGTPN